MPPKSWYERQQKQQQQQEDGHQCIAFSWGRSANGVLGHRQIVDQIVPTKLDTFAEVGLSSAAHIILSLGTNAAFAVTPSGQAYSWGNTSQRGQCADQGQDPVPRLMGPLSELHVLLIAAGQSHALAVVRGGSVYSWGTPGN